MASVFVRSVRAIAAPRVLGKQSSIVSSIRCFSTDEGEPKKTYKNRWYVNKKEKKVESTESTGEEALYNLAPEDQVPDEHTDMPTLPPGGRFIAGEGAYEEVVEFPQRMTEDELHQLVENNRDFVMNDDEEEVRERSSLQERALGDWNLGDVYLPEMMNWMLPRNERTPFKPEPRKAWTEFVKADLDPVELALNTDLLRLFISPNGRIVPRRFTGLRAKQQRQLAAAVKVSRQLGLLPYTSRYPLPSPEQMELMTQEAISRINFSALENMADEVDEADEQFEM